jgi:hypothetical protein
VRRGKGEREGGDENKDHPQNRKEVHWFNRRGSRESLTSQRETAEGGRGHDVNEEESSGAVGTNKCKTTTERAVQVRDAWQRTNTEEFYS